MPDSTMLDEVTTRLRRLEADAAHRAGRVAMRDLFDLARNHLDLAVPDVERLLVQPDHPSRLVAVSIMDFAARRRSTPVDQRRRLFRLYLDRHDHINTWDLVHRAAPHVVGGWLADKPRQPLYQLADSPQWWERRTAIVATWYFIRQGDLDDTFALATILAHDPHDLVQKAVGGWVREAGKRDPQRLTVYLDQHAATLPRTTLRYAIEHYDPDTRQRYLAIREQRARPPSPCRRGWLRRLLCFGAGSGECPVMRNLGSCRGPGERRHARVYGVAKPHAEAMMPSARGCLAAGTRPLPCADPGADQIPANCQAGDCTSFS